MRTALATQLDQAWDHVTRTVADRDFLLGDELTLADMQICYVLAVASATGSLEDRLEIEAYLARMMARPALARAIAAGGPMA